MHHVDHPFKSPTVLSFFPGILGLERGLERAIGPLRVLAYCEREAFLCENLVVGMESGILAPAPIWSDAKTFPWGSFHGRVTGLTGGYPCQPFSTAGKRNGRNDHRHLWPYIAQSISAIRPVWCFFENVAGHLTMGFPEVYASLRNMGYSVEAGIFTAEEVGAPHQRERLFILAVANSYLNDFRRRSREAEDTSCEIEGAPQGEDRKRSGHESGNLSKNVSNTESIGTGSGRNQQKEDREFGKQLDGSRKRSNAFNNGSFGKHPSTLGDPNVEGLEGRNSTISSECSSERTAWPAGCGEFQYEWEEPRTIKSGVGCTVNGYNFREDFLRALGNSVVEQTAELAFNTLLKQHLKG